MSTILMREVYEDINLVVLVIWLIRKTNIDIINIVIHDLRRLHVIIIIYEEPVMSHSREKASLPYFII